MQIFKNFFLAFLFCLITSEPALFAQNNDKGQLSLEVNLPEPFYLVLDNNLREAQKVDSGQVLDLSAGLYTFTIVSKFIDDHSFIGQIDSGRVTNYTHTFKVFRIDYKSTFKQLENQENLVIETDPESVIYLNGKLIGRQYASLLVNPGTYTIKTVHPTSGSLLQKVDIDWAETEYFSKFNQPQNNSSSSFYLLPGAGYVMNGQDDKAIATYLTMALLAGSYFTLDYKIKNQSAIFNIKDLKSRQTASLLGIGAVYLISILDGKRKPKSGYPGNSTNFELSTISLNQKLMPALSFNIDL